MSARNDGGPAFPMVATEYNHDIQERVVTSTGGMTLRDYFAAKAMQGILSDTKIDHPPSKLAELSYRVADAMLKAREE